MAQRDDPSPAEPGPHRWFVVANASRARAYVQRIGSPGYDVVREWDDPGARMTASDAGEDRSGADGSGRRVGAATANVEASPKGPEQRDLQRALVEDLAQALRRRELSGLYLVAPAPLLHRLRDALPADLRGVLFGEHAGDFTQRPTADVFAHLDGLRREAGGEPGLPHAR
jgi:protein required for attachment to host cells